jgi:hypothetical protein
VNEKSHFFHNHALSELPEEQAARAATRDRITPATLAKAHQAQRLLPKAQPAEIANFIRQQIAEETGAEPTWTNKDLANSLAPTALEVALDSANFLEEILAARAHGKPFCAAHAITCLWLFSQCACYRPLNRPWVYCFISAGAKVEYTLDEDRQLRCAVIVFREATLAAAIDDEDMWIYDITFGTNRQGYKLGLLTGVTRERRGYVMGMTFMDAETVENFTWVLTRCVSFVGCKPGVLLTDGCTKLYAAIVIVFGLFFATTCHLLCVWHLSNNVWEHIRPLFGAIVRGSKSGGSPSTLQWRAFNRECALWPTRPDLLE